MELEQITRAWGRLVTVTEVKGSPRQDEAGFVKDMALPCPLQVVKQAVVIGITIIWTLAADSSSLNQTPLYGGVEAREHWQIFKLSLSTMYLLNELSYPGDLWCLWVLAIYGVISLILFCSLVSLELCCFMSSNLRSNHWIYFIWVFRNIIFLSIWIIKMAQLCLRGLRKT